METKAEQYYPTYSSKQRDVLLIEFEEAQKIANGQTKVYGQVTNLLLAFITLSFTLFFSDESDKGKAATFLTEHSILLSVILFLFGAILLRYFVDLQKQITINARKVVTLRTLLGLDYGHIHLTLPNWRVEGATNPFAIKYFSGWLNFKAMPFWVLTISVNLVWFLATQNLPSIESTIGTVRISLSFWLGYVVISLSYLFLFRRFLNDRHETVYLIFVKTVCGILRIKLIDNFEYVLYRAKLSYLELDRLKVDYKKLTEILVEIEDNNFYSNVGVSVKSLVRGFLSRFPFIRKRYGYIEHGGSTITMQLARTLFIPTTQNKYLRKLAELLLSLWLYREFSKKEILKLYVASVRYERGVIGLSNALKYFWSSLRSKKLTEEEAFFLVERLSNVTSTVKQDRIDYLVSRTSANIDKVKLKRLYDYQVKKGHLK